MTQDLKHEIIQAAITYKAAKQLSSSELAKLSGINEGYLSNMLRYIFTLKVAEKLVDIQDRWFKKLAAAIDYRLETVRWDTLPTPQFVEIIGMLEHAKENGTTGIIIGDTGCGKTFAIDKFCLNNPAHTYRVTVSSLHTMPLIMEDLLTALGLADVIGAKNKIDRIAKHLLRLKEQGESVIILMDEAENLKIDVIRMLKALYDKAIGSCSIILVGTPELLDKIDFMKRQNRYGIPQFCRRFKAGTRYLSDIDKSFKQMLDKHVSDAGLRKLLISCCDNYGELRDYLYPVMKEANLLSKPLTEDLFRLYHNMPTYKQNTITAL